MDCSNRHDEAKAIRRGDIAATPTAGEVDAILCRDETGIRLGQCLLADIILPNPAQPRTPEGGNILPQQWFEAGVTRLSHQNGANARSKFAGAGFRLARMGECAGKSGSGIDLQQQFRQIDLRQAVCNGLPQGNEAGRFFELVEAGQYQVVAGTRLFYAETG